MELFEFVISLPAGFTVESSVSGPDVACHDIIGSEPEKASGIVIQKARAAGFSTNVSSVGRVELERGEQRLLLVSHSSGLTIQVYDPTRLPSARTDGTAVSLADFRAELGSDAVTPLREKHTEEDGHWWRAAWKVQGVSAEQLVARVIDEAVANKGLTRGAIFGPAKEGREVWSGEAYSKVELIKVRATVESEHVLLEMDLVDKR